jgi:adenylate kinase family enzyme
VDASDETMKKRLMEQIDGVPSSDLVKLNEEIITKKVDVFHEFTQPFIDYYEGQGKLKSVVVDSLEKTPDDVFAKVQKILDESGKEKTKQAEAKTDEIIKLLRPPEPIPLK